ncbi:Protein C41G11.1 a [Aphelenchoides avenae]|nr:Protein C41G11.1 a [Aphelenchus avenae]
MHNHSPNAAQWIKSALENWMKQVGNAPLRNVMVLYAHNHNQHSVTYECIAGMNVPHIYVGSVPKNR